MKKYCLLVFGMICYASLYAQGLDSGLFTAQPQYTILKVNEKISIDGKASEAAWSKAPWTKQFTDIKTGEESSPQLLTRAKMLWDDDYLYVYVLFPETDIWASLTDHDATVYQDNALEIFLDPDGDGHHYVEFQINALATVWDLIMTRPYRNGGRPISDWDIKGLKKAIHINGTLNHSGDQDQDWGIELAFPLKALSLGQGKAPELGTIWRMNLSRVQWPLEKVQDGYARKRDAKGKLLPSDYFAWSPQGIVNFHYPERWGYVQFGGADFSTSFLDEEIEEVKRSLWRCYYLQQTFQTKFGKYASSLEELIKEYPELKEVDLHGMTINGSQNQFWIENSSRKTGKTLAVDQSGYFFN